MKLVSFKRAGRTSWGIAADGGVVDAGGRLNGRFPTMRSALEADAVALIAQDAKGAEVDLPWSAIALLPPIPDPDKIIGFGLNYREHVIESGQPIPQHPSVFLRLANTLVGHGAPLIVPRLSIQLDYEVELAIVIGKAGRHVPVADALDYIAGYSCFNDASVRDIQFTHSLTVGKNFPATGGFGPWMVTRDQIPDPGRLVVKTRVNGVEVQNGNTDDLIFDVPAMVAYVSSFTSLAPGDVIATGTPQGVGFARKPPLWLKPDDVVEVEVEGVGVLRNPVIAEAA
jgi:2-keto-4-pentenoate hydratase/2-oxohepta-3-ene-1,7-dioic acid hydratase in catechol pathway